MPPISQYLPSPLVVKTEALDQLKNNLSVKEVELFIFVKESVCNWAYSPGVFHFCDSQELFEHQIAETRLTAGD